MDDDARRMIGEEDLARPPTLGERLQVGYRFLGVFGSAVPTTTVPPMALTALAYRRFEDEERYQKIHKVFQWADVCTRRVLTMDVRVRGRERLPGERRGVMFVCNHQSYVDIPMIMSTLRVGAFLSKSMVAFLPVVGQIAWLAGTIYFSRTDAESRRKALDQVLKMCQQSTAVTVFPEGTRSMDGNLRDKVHLKGVEACHERGIRVCAFAFHGTRYAFPYTMDRFHTNQRVAVVVGRTFDPGDFQDGPSFARAVWDEVRRSFDEARRMRQSPDWESFER